MPFFFWLPFIIMAAIFADDRDNRKRAEGE
jgi:hypothetical protein